MDILQLYQDFSVAYKTEGHKHCRPGWVNTECPWCEGNAGYHLGYEIATDRFVCWRCGWHPTVPTIAKLVNISEKGVYPLLKTYGILIPKIQESTSIISPLEHKLPSNTEPLIDSHKKYLAQRNFDPDYLEKEWKLLSTGPVSKLDEIDYRNRILIPFIWDGIQVSFDTRIPRNMKSYESRYKACPKNRELIPHKEILYGKQEKWKSSTICVEGPTDVWRFGPLCVGTSGIKYTPKQVRLLARSFKRIGVCFDGGETQAIEQANKLVADLKFRKVDAFRIDIEGDPGSMLQEDANYLVKQIVK